MAEGEPRFVGREFELEQLREALDRAGETRKAQLVTILGPPGMGKSRLAAALLDRAERAGALCLAGGCVEYGDESPLAPLREAFVAAGVDSAEAAAARLADSGDRDRVAHALEGLFAGAETDAATLRWSIRRTLEGLARTTTVLLVLDDVHRADTSLLDLLEYLGGVRTAALTLACLARPELLERRPDWGESDRHAFSIRLEPLSDEEGNELIDALGGAPAASRRRLLDGAAGNPLFLEQLLSLARSTGGVSAAPAIESLIAARLELLPEGERRTLGRAAVAGLAFRADSASEADPELDARAFDRLSQKALLDSSEVGSFRFRHSVIHEVAYRETAPEVRTELHERLADRADSPGERLFHLERAARHYAETRIDSDRSRLVATRAAEQLFELALAAAARGSLSTAIDLFERGRALLNPHEPRRAELLVELGRALGDAGRSDESRHVLEQARELGDDRVRTHAELALIRLDSTAPRNDAGWSTATTTTVESFAKSLHEAGDERGLAHAWCLLSELLLVRGEARAALGLAASALELAEQAGDTQLAARCSAWARTALIAGPTPLDEVVAKLKGELDERRALADEIGLLGRLATAEAMQGDGDAALEHVARATTLATEAELDSADLHAWHGRTALALGDAATAEPELRLAVAATMGPARAAPAALLGRAQLALDRVDEADRAADVARTAAADEDSFAQFQWRALAAYVRARQGRNEEAVALARAALSFVERTDLVDTAGEGELVVAATLFAAGEADKASAAGQRALERFQAKGDRSGAARAQRLLEELAAEPRPEPV